MFTHFCASPKSHSAASLSLLLTGLLLIANPSAQAETDKMLLNVAHNSPGTTFQPSSPAFNSNFDPNTTPNLDSEVEPSSPQIDPLNSPYPIPWEWMMSTQAEFSDKGSSGLRYYRSQALVSPDGHYAAYTRLQMQVEPESFRSRVTSVMFLENLQTGELRIIRATSPLAERLLEAKTTELETEAETPGILSVLIPVSWSANGERLLARQVEGFFNTSDVSDYAVIWERQTNQTTTLNPNQGDEEISILLGWNHFDTEQVLFRSGNLGEEDWPVWSVALNGNTFLARNQDPITYGQQITRSWTGSQSLISKQ